MYAEHFVKGGYAAIGWVRVGDLSQVSSSSEVHACYKAAYPEDTSKIMIGQKASQIARLLLDIKAGDYVITPAAESEYLYYGRVARDPSYFYAAGEDGCPNRHRRRVQWADKRLARSEFSVPFQNAIRAWLTVFEVSRREEFLAAIGVIEPPQVSIYDPYRTGLEAVLELGAGEFEALVGNLLTALGFEDPKVVGRSGDGGVDVIGEVNVANLARVKVLVQAKRYKLGTRISGGTVKELRKAIPFGGQGAFITTADFQEAAEAVAVEAGFPRIGLVRGRQLVDLLVEHWNAIPREFQERLGLKPGLVRA